MSNYKVATAASGATVVIRKDKVTHAVSTKDLVRVYFVSGADESFKADVGMGIFTWLQKD